jgi:hypothetical protein
MPDEAKLTIALLSLLGSFTAALVSIRIATDKRSGDIEDRILRRINEIRDEKRRDQASKKDAFRLYADPLSESATSLRYRLDEIAESPERAIYLNPAAPKSDYNDYKFWSTLYRLASTLGWIRAYRRERSYLDIADASSPDNLESYIRRFEATLADGPHIEDKRLREFIRHGTNKEAQTPRNPEKNLERDLAIKVENVLKSHLGDSKTSAHELSEVKKTSLVRDVAECISKGTGLEFNNDLLEQRKSKIIEILGIKEAWIYRDWQQAIGDLMIKNAPAGGRKYDVIGYREFIEIARRSVADPDNPDHRWTKSLYNLFSGLNLCELDLFDARQQQIKNTHNSTIELTAELARIREQYTVSSKPLV